MTYNEFFCTKTAIWYWQTKYGTCHDKRWRQKLKWFKMINRRGVDMG